MSNEDIEDIVNELRRLNIRQASLLARLETARDRQTEDNNRLKVGDYVRILNPRRLQQNKGTITKIGRSRVTIQTSNGTTITRSPKNVTVEPL